VIERDLATTYCLPCKLVFQVKKIISGFVMQKHNVEEVGKNSSRNGKTSRERLCDLAL